MSDHADHDDIVQQCPTLREYSRFSPPPSARIYTVPQSPKAPRRIAPQIVVSPAHSRRRLSSPEKPSLAVSPSRQPRRMSSAGRPSVGDVSRNPDWRGLFVASTPSPAPHRLRPRSVSHSQATRPTPVGRCSREQHHNSEVSPPTLVEQQAPTVKQLSRDLNTSVQSLDLGGFYPIGDPRLLELSRKAAALGRDKTATLNKPKDLASLTTLALFDTVVYCDDSGSMQYGDRIASLKEYVRRVTKITTMLDPAGISVRFINFGNDAEFNGIRTLRKVDEVMACTDFNGSTHIGTELEHKILNPLLFAKTRTRTLEKPLLITTVTDGAPMGESLDHFKNVILNCKKTLKSHGYSSRCTSPSRLSVLNSFLQVWPVNVDVAVVFQLGQVGDESDAEAFIQGLHNDPEVGDMVYCTSERLDTKIAELKQNDTDMERWLLHLLLGGSGNLKS